MQFLNPTASKRSSVGVIDVQYFPSLNPFCVKCSQTGRESKHEHAVCSFLASYFMNSACQISHSFQTMALTDFHLEAPSAHLNGKHVLM